MKGCLFIAGILALASITFTGELVDRCGSPTFSVLMVLLVVGSIGLRYVKFTPESFLACVLICGAALAFLDAVDLENVVFAPVQSPRTGECVPFWKED